MCLQQRENEVRKIYVFYADVFLAQNFFMDFAALYGVNFFLHRHRKKRWLVAAAVIGAVAGLILLLTVKNQMWYILLSHLLLNTLMVCIAFGRSGVRDFVENWAVTYLVFLLLGGMQEWLGESRILSYVSVPTLFWGIFGVYGILRYLMRRKDFKNYIVETQIKKQGRYLAVRAYRDSGNQLLDPYTGQGICILSKEKAGEIFDEKQDHFRLVPYHSLGENEGMLWVTDVDEVLLFEGNKTLCLKRVAVGIANTGLLEGKEYDLILHASFG